MHAPLHCFLPCLACIQSHDLSGGVSIATRGGVKRSQVAIACLLWDTCSSAILHRLRHCMAAWPFGFCHYTKHWWLCRYGGTGPSQLAIQLRRSKHLPIPAGLAYADASREDLAGGSSAASATRGTSGAGGAAGAGVSAGSGGTGAQVQGPNLRALGIALRESHAPCIAWAVPSAALNGQPRVCWSGACAGKMHDTHCLHPGSSRVSTEADHGTGVCQALPHPTHQQDAMHTPGGPTSNSRIAMHWLRRALLRRTRWAQSLHRPRRAGRSRRPRRWQP